MRIELERCLALNRHWQAISTISIREALKIVFRERGRIIDPETYQLFTWEEWCLERSVPIDAKVDEDKYLRTHTAWIRKPEVITLAKFAGFPNKGLPFSRRGVYERDNFQCVYCDRFLSRKTATIDHVLPVSKGGITEWTNCVTCCGDCNRKKGNTLLKDCNLELKMQPVRPRKQDLLLKGVKLLDSWRPFLTDEQVEQHVEAS